MIPFRLYLLILVGIAVLGLAYFLLRRKPKTADDLERERRAWLDRIGRITDGTVIDVQEMPGTRDRPSTFLIYQYDVAGVSYEASQDVTYLRQFINLHSCRLGLPTSVRFDPHNPGNSIVRLRTLDGSETVDDGGGLQGLFAEAENYPELT